MTKITMDGEASPGMIDRRRSGRYPIREQVRYRTVERRGNGGPIRGQGKTLDMSSRGVLFTTEGILPAGKLLELSVNWPAQLNGGCPLQLVALGHVVRVDADCAAISIERYEFRTRAERQQDP